MNNHKKVARKIVEAQPGVELRMGVVTALNGGSPRTVNATVAGVTVANVPIVDGVAGLVGSTIWIAAMGKGSLLGIAQVSSSASVWTAPTFTNSWVNYGAAHQVAQYRKVGDMVQLRGFIAAGSNATSAFTLPAGLRPLATQIFTVVSNVNNIGYVDIRADGQVIPADIDNTWVTLAGIQFSVTA